MKISVVVPSFNEEGNIPEIVNQLTLRLAKYDSYEIIFVDDGSSDQSLTLLEKFHTSDRRVNYISLSRNFGHQNALKAGLDFASGDCIVSMDADLQHPPEMIDQLIEKWLQGYDIVYTKRMVDKKLSFFKRKSSSLFYKLINFLSDTKIEDGTADFRLVDKSVLSVFSNMKENDLFIRGLMKWVGFKQFCIEYYPNTRFSGTSKYSVAKMFKFALKGITSFSVKPLYLSTLLGSFISLLAFGYGIYALCIGLFTDRAVSGWSSVIISVLFIGGLQLMMMGIIGEYIGKLFMQAKGRPQYIIRKKSF
ncbi:MAG: glycosyltransferase family 2 protein [Bacteroidetes bacterium]|nr:glycosyltransferase family 2 protein [Bacteroidota bacterium]